MHRVRSYWLVKMDTETWPPILRLTRCISGCSASASVAESIGWDVSGGTTNNMHSWLEELSLQSRLAREIKVVPQEVVAAMLDLD